MTVDNSPETVRQDIQDRVEETIKVRADLGAKSMDITAGVINALYGFLARRHGRGWAEALIQMAVSEAARSVKVDPYSPSN